MKDLMRGSMKGLMKGSMKADATWLIKLVSVLKNRFLARKT